MNTASRFCYQCARLPFLTVLALIIFGSNELQAGEAASACDTVTKITGEYQCAGQCIVTTEGKRELTAVSGEPDTVTHFAQPDKQQSDLFYQVDIKNGTFHEIELGSLVGPVLRAATAAVSDNEFPVLEEYRFKIGPACHALGYTKIVSNPSKENFKSCVVYCKKTDL
jgi:hypothetical protein